MTWSLWGEQSCGLQLYVCVLAMKNDLVVIDMRVLCLRAFLIKPYSLTPNKRAISAEREPSSR